MVQLAQAASSLWAGTSLSLRTLYWHRAAAHIQFYHSVYFLHPTFLGPAHLPFPTSHLTSDISLTLMYNNSYFSLQRVALPFEKKQKLKVFFGA